MRCERIIYAPLHNRSRRASASDPKTDCTHYAINKIFSALEKQVIDLQGHSEFSNAYVLKADNRNDIKIVFADQVLSYLVRHRGLTIEGNGNRLIFYRSNTLLKPDELSSFIDEGLELFRMIK